MSFKPYDPENPEEPARFGDNLEFFNTESSDFFDFYYKIRKEIRTLSNENSRDYLYIWLNRLTHLYKNGESDPMRRYDITMQGLEDFVIDTVHKSKIESMNDISPSLIIQEANDILWNRLEVEE